MSNISELIKMLDQEWEYEKGFFGKLRNGFFDQSRYIKVKDILNSIINAIDPNSKLIDKRLVEITWIIPIFMEWQTERVKSQSGNIDELLGAKNEMEDLLQDILGVP